LKQAGKESSSELTISSPGEQDGVVDRLSTLDHVDLGLGQRQPDGLGVSHADGGLQVGAEGAAGGVVRDHHGGVLDAGVEARDVAVQVDPFESTL